MDYRRLMAKVWDWLEPGANDGTSTSPAWFTPVIDAGRVHSEWADSWQRSQGHGETVWAGARNKPTGTATTAGTRRHVETPLSTAPCGRRRSRQGDSRQPPNSHAACPYVIVQTAWCIRLTSQGAEHGFLFRDFRRQVCTGAYLKIRQRRLPANSCQSESTRQRLDWDPIRSKPLLGAAVHERARKRSGAEVLDEATDDFLVPRNCAGPYPQKHDVQSWGHLGLGANLHGEG